MSVAACLIVKNEARVIDRCLASVRPLVDAVVVVDTGSTDDTVKQLQRHDKVNLFQRPWVNFGHNRTELIDLARPLADYLLLLDADQTVSGSLPPLDADAHNVRIRMGDMEWRRPLLIRSALPWRYIGVRHEYLDCPASFRQVDCDSLTIIEHADGARRASGTTLLADAEAFDQQLIETPGEPRTVFYAARTYDDLYISQPGDVLAPVWKAKAEHLYQKRSTITTGYGEEAFYSLYRLGVLRLWAVDGLKHLLQAWQRYPHRWEPVHEACRWLNQQGLYQASYALSSQALGVHSDWKVTKPNGLFISLAVYDHLLLFEHGISAYYCGWRRESLEACETVISRQPPKYIEDAARRNMAFSSQAT